MTKDINFTNPNVNGIINMPSSSLNPQQSHSAGVKRILYMLVDWCCSRTNWLIACNIVLFLCPLIGWECISSKHYWLGGGLLLGGIIAIVISQLINDTTEKKIKEQCAVIEQLNKNAKDFILKEKAYQANYCSVLILMSTLFDHQMMILHNSISDFVTKPVRTSIYIYDVSRNEFHCLARYSKHPIYSQKNYQDIYANKGWLQSTWNQKQYKFTSHYTTTEEWVKDCQTGCKQNCLNNDTCRNPCIHGKREHLPKENCPMLSKNELKKKRMKARSVYGYILEQGTNSLGIILVEGMDIWENPSWEKIRNLVIQHSSSPLEIFSSHGKQLLKLLNTADKQKDMAEGFSITEIGGQRHAK